MIRTLSIVALVICLTIGTPVPKDNRQKPEAILAQTDLWQGDIAGHEPWTRNAILNPNLKWPNGRVPYVIEPGHFSCADLSVIQTAMDSFASETCARFVPRTTETDYIHIFSENGCWSYVGRNGGQQDISLQNPGCVNLGLIQHGLMHSLGIWHEQSRYDRDDYIEIQWNNIKPGYEHNFEIIPSSQSQTFGLPYDYDSLMHCGAYDFSINTSNPAFITIPPGIPAGERESGFSSIDIAKINSLYPC